jgi:hypothetical protein
MADKDAGGEAGRERLSAEDREVLNADGQSARLVTNTTGEYSIERAREGFDKAFAGEAKDTGEEEKEAGG